jgi:hypothetical protein
VTPRPAPPVPAALRLAAFFLAALALVPTAARAGTEEWSTFDVFAQEEDDESLLDHLLTRTPGAWRDEWQRSEQALRTSQGCLTSGQWFVASDLKLRSALGRRARFGLDVRETESDRASFTYFDFSFRFPTAHGTPGAMFRPFHDKSRQDFALFWEAGAETSATRARLAFTFEDAFNNLWAFRQTRVGNVSEPYERHPFEPALALAVRRDRWRAEFEAVYLTPSRKLLAPDPAAGNAPRATLWGTYGRAAFELEALGTSWKAGAENRQASSTQTIPGLPAGSGEDFRRQWSAEGSAGRAFGRGLEIEARWIYQARDQATDPPLTARSLGAVDRVAQLEGRFPLWAAWAARVGALHDRVTVGWSGAPFPTYGTRVESRAYVGLTGRFGQVSVSAVEGIELDPEPYEVWWVHDKAFLHLQTTF